MAWKYLVPNMAIRNLVVVVQADDHRRGRLRRALDKLIGKKSKRRRLDHDGDDGWTPIEFRFADHRVDYKNGGNGGWTYL